MHRLLKIHFAATLLAAALLIAADPDSGLELIHADKIVGKEADGQKLRILLGHVHFHQDTIDMYCDQAVDVNDQQLLKFIGNVLIDDGHSRLRADSIEYYPDKDLAICKNRVRMKRGNDSLYAEFFTYNFKTEQAAAKKNVYLYNEENQVQIWGDYGEYDPENKHSMVERNSRFMKVDTASGDTLTITARQLNYYDRKEETRAVAIDSVTITQGALRAVCDTAIYLPETEKVFLNRKPFVWYEESELSGNRMEAYFDSLKLREIYVDGEGMAKSLADSVKMKYNVLNGREIRFFIENDKPEKIKAIDNATSIYYLKDEDSDQGVNFATADTIVIFFAEGELDSIQIRGGAEGVFYPGDYEGEKVFEQGSDATFGSGR